MRKSRRWSLEVVVKVKGMPDASLALVGNVAHGSGLTWMEITPGRSRQRREGGRAEVDQKSQQMEGWEVGAR